MFKVTIYLLNILELTLIAINISNSGDSSKDEEDKECDAITESVNNSQLNKKEKFVYRVRKEYKPRENVDSAGRKIDSSSKLDDDGNVLNRDESVRSLYKRSNFVKPWSIAETQKFYEALSVFGTDFSLMRLSISTRSAEELKSKFRKEDKINRNLVEKALEKKYVPEEFEDQIGKILETLTI